MVHSGRARRVGHLTARPPLRPDCRQPVWRADLERAGDAKVRHGRVPGCDGRLPDRDAVSRVSGGTP